jgi:Xaa-Pro aminopeptidase
MHGYRAASPGLKDHEAQIDMPRMRAYRLGRLQSELARRDLGACVLFNPINIRYATGSRNFPVWGLHFPGRYAFVPVQGLPVLFEFPGSEFRSRELESIGDVRTATSWYYKAAGPRASERASRWAAEIDALLRERAGANRRLGLDFFAQPSTLALEMLGLELFDFDEGIEAARLVKSDDELGCMVIAIAGCESGIARMRDALRPGIAENQLWALLHQANIEAGGEWIETRLLSSGGRTNPWYQEASDRLIRAGDLVAFDTDLIGAFGYSADISRTFLCGPGKPNASQRAIYRIAYDQLQHNIALLRPGITFLEFSERSLRVPPLYLRNRYGVLAHGVGLCNEYPSICHPEDWSSSGYDGVLEPNMVLSVESYVGAESGIEGVKLEEQVLISKDGVERLSRFPYEDALLA